MPILEIDGVGRVEVGPEFTNLSPEQQHSTVQEIVSSQTPQRGTVSVKPYRRDSAMDTATAVDAAKSGGVGIAKGTIGLAGTPGDIGTLTSMGFDKALQSLGFSTDTIEKAKGAAKLAAGVNPVTNAMANGPTSGQIQKQVENVTGDFYKPQTRVGDYAQTIGEMIPGAVVGPGGMARNAITFGAVPGAVSEFVAGIPGVKGTALEPYVRGASALISGGVGGILTAPKNSNKILGQSIQGIDQQTMQQAEALFQEAQRAGMPITRAEAVQHVTNGATNLGDIQRVVEGQGGLKQFFADRPQSNAEAAGRAFDNVAPQSVDPHSVGPSVGEAASETLNGVRQDINTLARPHYQAGEAELIRPYDWAQIQRTPGWQEARDAVRNNPQLNRYVSHLPDNSVGFIDAVKQYFDEAARNASNALNPQQNHKIAAGLTSDAATVRQWGVNTSRQIPGNPYETALNIESSLREQYLQPLMNGPLGQLAKKDITTKNAIGVLFPASPLENSAPQIAQTVAAVSQRAPGAARELVRQHLAMTFAETTQNLQTGMNQFGGAKFAATIRGNPQQAENLEAAVRALPNGDNIWPGVDRFLTILEAQGQRQRIGSQTAFNQEMQTALKQGSPAQEAANTVATGLVKLPAKIKERIDLWQLSSSTDDVARMLTDPTAGREFARLANSNSDGATAMSIVRLLGLTNKPAQSNSNPR